MTTIPARPTAPAEDFAAAGRAPKVKALADTLEQFDIPAEDAKLLNPGQWKRLADGLGINAPSPTTVSAVVDELKARESETVQRRAQLSRPP